MELSMTSLSVDTSVFLQLAVLKGSNPLCPSLQSLFTSAYCAVAFLFLTNTLKKLCIGCSDRSSNSKYPTPAAWNLLDLLHERTPLLEDLEIGPGVLPGGATLESILKLKNLQRLSFSSMDRTKVREDWLEKLQVLPHLRSLNLGLYPQFLHDQFGFYEREQSLLTYPALSELAMTCFEAYAAVTLKRMPKDTIRTFTLHVNDALPIDTGEQETSEDYLWDDDDQDSLELIPLLVQTQSLSLTKLQITNWRKIQAEHLKPLLQIGTIKHFDLEYVRCSALTDDLIKQICSSWPRLATFRLYSDTNEPVQLSLSALESFAKHCPDLHQLSIDLDINAVALRSANSDRPPFQLKHVTVFSVSNWSKVHGGTTTILAKYLATVFPSLIYAYVKRRSGSFSGRPIDYRHSYNEDWESVFSILLEGMDYHRKSRLKAILEPRPW